VIFALAAIFYFTQKTSFLASGRPAIHWKHAIRLHRADAARRGRRELRPAEVDKRLSSYAPVGRLI